MLLKIKKHDLTKLLNIYESHIIKHTFWIYPIINNYL